MNPNTFPPVTAQLSPDAEDRNLNPAGGDFLTTDGADATDKNVDDPEARAHAATWALIAEGFSRTVRRERAKLQPPQPPEQPVIDI